MWKKIRWFFLIWITLENRNKSKERFSQLMAHLKVIDWTLKGQNNFEFFPRLRVFCKKFINCLSFNIRFETHVWFLSKNSIFPLNYQTHLTSILFFWWRFIFSIRKALPDLLYVDFCLNRRKEGQSLRRYNILLYDIRKTSLFHNIPFILTFLWP